MANKVGGNRCCNEAACEQGQHKLNAYPFAAKRCEEPEAC